ncbi:PREDICTED: endochitinase A-like, partial [Rhagoletis zephyria]|uniref:endochitinase A-like n=1 Tax=Rhagoletis zephyria TaxID=28612 RepID=UPI0008119071
TTEPEGTTSFQIDETTVVEANDESATVPEAIPLLEAISKQQQLEFQKLKVESVEDEASIKTTSPETAINEQTTTADDDNTTIETKTIANEKVDTTTAKEAVEKSEKSVEATTATETTTQPLTSAVALSSTIIATTTTTKIHLTTTPSTDRFRSSPAAAVVAPIRIATDKQVSDVVKSATAPTTDATIGEETAPSSIDVVSDVPRSGNNDLVNVAAASSIKTSDTKNDSRTKNKNNKKPPARIAASAKATMAASEINIEQELRMINELVKGKRQLAALKMAALKATTMTQAATSAQKTTASEPKLVVKKSANAAENEQNARGVAAVEVRHDVDETTTKVATVTAETTTVVNSPLVAASGSKNEVLHTTATTTTDGTKAATQKEATAKMESGSQPAETTTVENTTAAEALSKIVELATTTATATAAASAEPDFEAEATAPSVEATGATLWSRIMPLFGFGVTAVETGAKAGAAPTAAATTTAVPAAEELAGGAAIGSISSSNRFS